jgi:hypothetical protein
MKNSKIKVRFTHGDINFHPVALSQTAEFRLEFIRNDQFHLLHLENQNVLDGKIVVKLKKKNGYKLITFRFNDPFKYFKKNEVISLWSELIRNQWIPLQ